MVEYVFTLCTKYSLYLYTQKKKTTQPNYPNLNHIEAPNFKKKKKITLRGFGVLIVVGGLYNRCGDPLNSSFSLFQMFCQSQVFYFGNI